MHADLHWFDTQESCDKQARAADQKKYETGLTRVLSDRDPDGSNVHALLLVHLAYIRDDQLAATKSARRFGIARGPGDLPEADDLTRLLEDFTSGFATHFERGRLALGLESLTEEYLKVERRFGTEDQRTIRERDQLLNVLVQFATKVLFVANNSAILRTEQELELNPYVLVLQAVGNSLLNQADELWHRSTHRSDLKKRWKTEEQALKHVYSRNAQGVLDTVITQLQERHTLTATALKETQQMLDALTIPIIQARCPFRKSLVSFFLDKGSNVRAC